MLKLCVLTLLTVLPNQIDALGCKSDGTTQATWAARTGGLGVIQSVMVEMRDGVKLHTNVLSKTSRTDRVPTIIDRSPYGGQGTELIADIYSALGDFVAIGQDMRGTCKSEGNFTMWRKDGEDSYDTMAWIAQQPWSNGQVYTVGGSADGIAQFVIVKERPQWLVSQFIIFATIDAMSTVYPGGAYRQGLIDGWLHSTVPHQAATSIATAKSHNGAGPWWDPLNISAPGTWGDIEHAAVMWGGWYDIFLQGNLNGYYIYQYLAQPAVRGKSFLVVDPLGHCQDAAKYFPGALGLIDGRSALGALLSLQMVEGNGTITKPAEGVKAVTFYVMGPDPSVVGKHNYRGNYWSSLDHWPEFTSTKMYLGAEGSLSSTASPTTTNVSYVYDPKDPVPTLGGNNLEVQPCGPSVQNGNGTAQNVENRSDVLLHTSAPLTDDVYVTGPLKATLFVSTSAVDTDFTAKLTDVYPDGSSHLIQDGILRMRWREGAESATYWPSAPSLVVPHQTYRIEVDLWNTSYVFNKGHRIRVAVSSSNAPRFKPNPNIGVDISVEDQHEPVVATNTIFYGGDRASFFELPVVSKAQLPKKIILLDPNKPTAASKHIKPELVRAAHQLTKFVAGTFRGARGDHA